MWGGVAAGGGRRQVGKKARVALAAEVRGRTIGRIRMRRIRDLSAARLRPFIQEAIMPSQVVGPDGVPPDVGRPEGGSPHARTVILVRGNPAPGARPRVHRVASRLDRGWRGPYQGAIRPQPRAYDLAEFPFRFNRRTSRSRGKRFDRWVQPAAVITPTPYQALVGGRPQQNRSKVHTPLLSIPTNVGID